MKTKNILYKKPLHFGKVFTLPFQCLKLSKITGNDYNINYEAVGKISLFSNAPGLKRKLFKFLRMYKMNMRAIQVYFEVKNTSIRYH